MALSFRNAITVFFKKNFGRVISPRCRKYIRKSRLLESVPSFSTADSNATAPEVPFVRLNVDR